MEALGKGGVFLYLWCKPQSELELKCSTSSALETVFVIGKIRELVFFTSLLLELCALNLPIFPWLWENLEATVPREIPNPAAGVSFQIIGNDKLGGKDSKSIFSSVVGLVTQRVIQKNASCSQI